MKYRKRPVVIEAFQITKETRENNSNWPNYLHLAWNKEHTDVGSFYPVGEKLMLTTLEGPLTVSFGDWIIQGIQGELYPCKPDIFEKTYELVPEDRQ